MDDLKAFEVTEGLEGYGAVVFAKTGVEARRRGAEQLDKDFEDIESCRRAPHFDCYSPGPVMPLVLLDHGWWFECSHCGRRVTSDMEDELRDDGLDPADFVPEPCGAHGVFCSATCAAIHRAERRANADAEEALLELFEAKFPGATATRVHVYGTKLEPSAPMEGMRCNVSFMFPGAKYGATWVFGESFVHVAQGDRDAFNAWNGRRHG